MKPIRSVLVANRGEIAVRVFRTLRCMGIAPLAVFTDADAESLHPRLADRAVHIGPPEAYLDVDSVVRAALASGADALHPGYGFLSENPALAEACATAGVTFIGPAPESIRAMGDKINAKNLATAAGVPVVPGVSDRSLDDEQLAEAAVQIGLPVLLKPSAGGGGKGMRRVEAPGDLPAAIAAARREAVAAFGDGTLLVERFVARPRHIEIQVLADNHGSVVALGERECSLQRRHQKIIEESPSPLLDAETRSSMEGAAVAVAKACGYSGAGTVEFIVSADRPDEFFFMEMNTRLQVEHPVTEMVRGIDLVEWQVRVASGERLPWKDPPMPRGHAVEARIYAEDPARGFLPSTGTVRVLHEAAGQGIRVDSALALGTVVGVSYDPMLAKVVAWGEDRDHALARLRGALDATAVGGLRTNISFLRALLDHEDVVSAELDTGLVERALADLLAPPDESRSATVAALLVDAHRRRSAEESDPWRVNDGWRVGGPAPRRSRWFLNGGSGSGDGMEVAITGDPGRSARVTCDARSIDARVQLIGQAEALVELDHVAERYLYARDGDSVWLCIHGDSWELTELRESIGSARHGSAVAGPIISPMPGTVLAVHVAEGATVAKGDPLVTIEAMKMEHVVAAPGAGTVSKVLVAAQQAVSLGQPLAELDAAEEP
ncbi:MAG TPA: biotin carboxylase N-terminal domain-containing protein [Acidimicrobiales bacterium]|nr:biotin carboxylase N-terminal domain-containing protein [Acidimicrobiales bacterium]